MLFSPPRSDTASLTSLGYCRIEGRIKDMIIRGGENIYPAEIEQLLYTHPQVQEVQVRGTTSGGQQSICKQSHSSAVVEIQHECLCFWGGWSERWEAGGAGVRLHQAEGRSDLQHRGD